MAYRYKDLSVLVYANGFTHWHYTTPDSADVVTAPGYFDEAADMLRAGDTIFANVDTDGEIGAVQVLVRRNQGGVVTCIPVLRTEA